MIQYALENEVLNIQLSTYTYIIMGIYLKWN